MEISELIYIVTSLASAVAAILAWIAKIRWSDEYSKAKDEILKSKDEQIKALEREIQSLKELTPMKIREYFMSVRQQIEEYNDLLKTKLDETNQELEIRNARIEKLENQTVEKNQSIEDLKREIDSIFETTVRLDELKELYMLLEQVTLVTKDENYNLLLQKGILTPSQLESFASLRSHIMSNGMPDTLIELIKVKKGIQ